MQSLRDEFNPEINHNLKQNVVNRLLVKMYGDDEYWINHNRLLRVIRSSTKSVQDDAQIVKRFFISVRRPPTKKHNQMKIN